MNEYLRFVKNIMEDGILVELISNPTVTRLMSANSLAYNSSKWRKVGETPKVEEPIKKKDVVSPVVAEEPSGILLGLRTQYETLTGKKPDGRWNLARITKEIHNLQPSEL